MNAPLVKKGITRMMEAKRVGDEVANRAAPIARAIHRATGVDLANCGGCAASKRGLNGGGSLPGEQNPTVI